MRPALTLAALLTLAACDRPASRPTEPPAAPAPAAPAPDKAPATASWVFGKGQNSVELIHVPASGDPRDADLRMVCAADDGFLIVLPGLVPVGSEERLTLGSGGQAHTLVATPAGQGVKATGPIEEPLLAIIESGGPIGVNHGAQNAGPFEAPPEAVRRAFADTCRQLRARGAV